MEKLPMCRICLVEHVRMHVVADRNLQEVYEKLTNIQFVTKDSRPMLACFFCYTKLKQCWQLQRKCLEAEEVLAQMLNEDYEENPLTDRVQLEFFGGFIRTPIEHVSVVDVSEVESADIKEELPDVSDMQQDIEIKVEHLEDEIELERLAITYPDQEIPLHYTDTDDNVINKLQKQFATNKLKLETTITTKDKKNRRSNSKNIHSDEKPYKCKICQCDVTTKSALAKHMREIHDEKPYKCNECHYSFASKSYLNSHVRVHTNEKPYTCDICQRSFREENYLTVHMRVHSDKKPYKCDICQRRVTTNSALKKHMHIHTGEKPYKCDICQQRFKKMCTLRLHIPIHTGVKPYECELCKHRYYRKGDLAKHMRVHTGEKPYKCDVCGHTFNELSKLHRHIRVHTGEKPYKCDICLSRFNNTSDLKKHRRIHTGERPYKCGICHRGFSQSTAVKNHLKIHMDAKA